MKLLEAFKLFGPNRRCEQTAVEVWLRLAPQEAELMERHTEDHQSRAIARLARAGLNFAPGHPLRAPLAGSGSERYAALLARIALALQQHAGHRVAFQATYPAPDPGVCCLVVEYEHGEAGMEAVRLGVLLLEEAIPEILLGGSADGRRETFVEALGAYLRAAPDQRLPRQTQDIIDAAARLDIPVVKLDRDPYQGVSGDFRICPNGMLKLGHGCRQRVVDGTFPIDSGDVRAAIARDRVALRQALESRGAPLPEARVCMTTRQALRAAGEIGFPVRLRSRVINRAARSEAAITALNDRRAVSDTARRLLRTSPGLIVEAFVAGRVYQAILANGSLVAVLELKSGVAAVDVSSAVPAETRSWLVALARGLDAPMMTASWSSPDIAQPLPQSGKLIDLDVAPILDGLFPENAPVPSDRIRGEAAEGLLRFLFPGDARARIPIVAVTGTNGKSTVCAMIARVMHEAGRRVGRAGTTGIHVNGEMVKAGDFSGGKGHHLVLESPEVDFAVLETARGAATGFGLMFDSCDLAVCTNVSADHLGARGIDTVEQMAKLKRWIVRRARDCVVLNADNEYSVAMLPHLPGRKAWVVSATLGAEALRARFGDAVAFCVVEASEDEEWIALHPAGRNLPVMPLNEIPATLGGIAQFNVSNALQAVAACYQMGAPVEAVRSALRGFGSDFQDNPGRLNFHDGLPFRVLFDFGHNPDGFKALRPVVESVPTDGRRILAIPGRALMAEESIFEMTAVIAGSYDLFVCSDGPRPSRRKPGETAALIRKGLVSHGVPEGCVFEVGQDEIVDVALGLAQPGDFLILLTTTETLHDDWAKIGRHRANSFETG